MKYRYHLYIIDNSDNTVLGGFGYNDRAEVYQALDEKYNTYRAAGCHNVHFIIVDFDSRNLAETFYLK